MCLLAAHVRRRRTRTTRSCSWTAWRRWWRRVFQAATTWTFHTAATRAPSAPSRPTWTCRRPCPVWASTASTRRRTAADSPTRPRPPGWWCRPGRATSSARCTADTGRRPVTRPSTARAAWSVTRPGPVAPAEPLEQAQLASRTCATDLFHSPTVSSGLFQWNRQSLPVGRSVSLSSLRFSFIHLFSSRLGTHALRKQKTTRTSKKKRKKDT